MSKRNPLDNQDSILGEIARKVRESSRLVPKEVEKTILTLCQGRWLTRKQLADLLGRNSDGLRARFLTQMVGHGLLELKYPDKPNRADQAYTSKLMDDKH